MPEILHMIEFQMSFLLFIALAGYLAASRINQSVVIAEIVLGLIVGPSVLGIVTYTNFVSSIAHLGAVVLLFVVGLEFALEEIAKPRYLLIATAGVLVPWGAGYAIALIFGFSFESSVFIGTAMTATSIAITANVLKEMGKLQTAVARAIIGAAVIDDVLSLLVLAVGTGLITGQVAVGPILLVFLKSVLFLGIGGVVGRFGLRRLLLAIDKTKFTKRYPEVTFIFAIMTAFLYGMAAELAGLSAIVGAFVAGASLAGAKIRTGRDLHHASESLMIIFSSIFFVSLGVLADIRSVDTRIILFLIALTLVAFASKLIGCGGVALLARSTLRDAAIIGFGMAPRGEVAMIIALIGLDRGLIGQDVYVCVILMSLLTTVVTPVLLRDWLFKPGRMEKQGA